MSALENGLRPNVLCSDAPFVIDQGKGLGKVEARKYGKFMDHRHYVKG